MRIILGLLTILFFSLISYGQENESSRGVNINSKRRVDSIRIWLDDTTRMEASFNKQGHYKSIRVVKNEIESFLLKFDQNGGLMKIYAYTAEIDHKSLFNFTKGHLRSHYEGGDTFQNKPGTSVINLSGQNAMDSLDSNRWNLNINVDSGLSYTTYSTNKVTINNDTIHWDGLNILFEESNVLSEICYYMPDSKYALCVIFFGQSDKPYLLMLDRYNSTRKCRIDTRFGNQRVRKIELSVNFDTLDKKQVYTFNHSAKLKEYLLSSDYKMIGRITWSMFGVVKRSYGIFKEVEPDFQLR